MFENNPNTFQGEITQQAYPVILRGDGETWQLIEEGNFSRNPSDSDILLYSEVLALGEKNQEIAFFTAYPFYNSELGLGYVKGDNSVVFSTEAYKMLGSSYMAHKLFKILTYNDQFVLFGTSQKPDSNSNDFNIWMSQDGLSWNNHQPQLNDVKDNLIINDAINGPEGLAAVGYETMDRDYQGEAVALFSTDAQSWEKITLHPERMEGLKLTVTDAGYFAFESSNQSARRKARFWQSEDGKSWDSQNPIILNKLDIEGEWNAITDVNIHITRIIGFPKGLVGLGGTGFETGRTILFSGEVPVDYMNQK
ncbi:MAG: hypothetical protein GX783_00150 [Clostridiales bacterium]|nr:hypothetical protein [Clostridiales bacterium]